MRILHVYKDYAPVVGGIENHVRMLAEAQQAAGHDVTVLVCAPGLRGSVNRVGGVRVVKAGRLGTLASMPLSLTQPLRLTAESPDVIHVHSPYPLGEAAAWLMGRAPAAVLTHHSDVVRQRRLLAVWGPVLAHVLRDVDAVIATSPRYVETSPWLAPVRARCRIVPLGINLSTFPAGERAPRAGRPRLLFVGKLRHYKGVETLLAALGELPGVELDLVGEGPLRQAWEAMARERGLGERVRFRGELPEAALRDAYRAADIFVLPSSNRAEAFGTVLLEAMAAGLPLVSTEVGTGTSWVNQDGVTGRVVPPSDAGALAAALRGLVDAPALRLEMGRRARARVEAEFNLPRMVDGVNAVYVEALASRRALGWRRALPAAWR